jgi:hypothetical protein
MAEINLKLKGLAEIRKELKQLQFDLSQATDPQQMAELSEKAGVLRDNLQRANEQVSVFAAGSPFEQTNNALGLMGGQIMSLDFEGASESAKLFAQAAKGINGQVIATQLKGLGSTVKTLGSTFAKLGVTILANPIFLMAAAIAGIIAIVGALMSKLGLLQPILDGIGAVFDFLKGVIDAVVQSIKDFLDWIGLTDFAAEESAEKQAAAADKVIEANKRKTESIVTGYDREIRLANIAGEDTVRLEKEKQRAIIESGRIQIEQLKIKLESNKITKSLSEEEVKAIKDSIREQRKLISDSRFEIKAINAQSAEDKQKDRDTEISENKAAYAKMLADRKKFEQDRLNAIRQIRDLELDLMQEGIQKELALNTEKYTRLIEDTLKNESFSDQEKQRYTDLLRQQEFERTKEIELGYSQQLADSVKAADDARKLTAEEERLAKEEYERERNEKQLEYLKEYNSAQLEADKTLFDARLGLATGLVSAIGELAGKNKAVANALFAIDKALAIGEIVVSTQREIAGYASNPTWTLLPDGGATIKASYIAAAKIRAATSIATIAASSISKFMGGGGASVGGGGSTGGGGASGSTTAAQPSVNLFGQNNNANNLTSPQSVEQSNEIVVKAVVSETEVTGTQNKIKKMTESAAL